MIFSIVYVVYLIVCLLFGTVPFFGPITLRHMLTLVLFVWSIAEGGFKLDKFLRWYCVFLAFSAIGALLTGCMLPFANRLLGTYFSSIVLYISTKIVIKKYNGFLWILYTLLSVCLLNAIVVIAQFYGSPLAFSIPEILHIDYSEEMLELYERLDDFHGRYVGGVLGVVQSGYYLSAMIPLCLYNKKDAPTILNWSLFIITAFSLLLVQERAGLFIGILAFGLYYVICVKRKKRGIWTSFAVFVVLVVVLLRYGASLFSFDEMRYSTMGLEMGGRENLTSNGWHYFINNPLGGIDAYHIAGNRDPHTIFVNAFLHGGLFGGIVLLGIIIVQSIKVGGVMIEAYTKKRHTQMLIVCSIAYLVYTLNSLAHNASLASGVPTFFLYWAAVVSLLEKEKREKDVMVNSCKKVDQ